MKKYFAIGMLVLLAVSCGKQTKVVKEPGQADSTDQQLNIVIFIEPSRKENGKIFYSHGAAAKVFGENLQSVEIKYKKSGQDFSLGFAGSLSSQIDTWAFLLPPDIDSDDMWAEGQGAGGRIVYSQNLGPVAFEPQTTYASEKKYGFAIDYPKDFQVFKNINTASSVQSYIPVCQESDYVCLQYVGTDYTGTNFEGAGVSVSILDNLKTAPKCHELEIGYVNEGQQTINGVLFYTGSNGSAAAGHFMESKIYRAFHNNKCYQITEAVASSNIANYEPGAIKEFNENEMLQRLQGIVTTYRFADVPALESVKLKICPDEWYQNDMPIVSGTPESRQYFIVKGQRRELAEFDVDWIKKNCSVKLQVVY